MSCVFDECNQGRKSCTRSECGYFPLTASDEAADESPTSFDAFAAVLYVITAGLSLACFALFIFANLDRLAALVGA